MIDIRAVDLNLLPVLDALLRHRSVTMAARELNMSQSALSAALSRLREVLGDALFVRTGRGLLPTPRTLSLSEPIAELMELVRNRVLSPKVFLPAVSDRTFSICHSDVGSYVLWPKILREVTKLAPHARLELKILPQEKIAAALESAEIDVAIGAFPKLPPTLFQRRLFERKYVAVVRNHHPLVSKKLTLQNFAKTPQLVVRLASGIQEQIEELLAQRGLSRQRILEMPSYLMLPPILESSDYLAVMPGQLADAFETQARFKSFALPVTIQPSVIKLHWHRRAHEESANIWLRGLITELFSNH